MNNFIHIEDRVLEVAHYFLEKDTTIRETARVFGVSKSTIHTDLTSRLSKLNKHLYLEVRNLLDENFEQKHIRGGESTKRKSLREYYLTVV